MKDPMSKKNTVTSLLSMFFKRLRCRHKTGYLLAIEWDGTSHLECDKCGKIVRIPL